MSRQGFHPAAPATRSDSTSSMSTRLLILDDDRHIGTHICMVAASVDVDARSVVTAGEFRSALRTWRPDIAIVDLRLDDGDGIELIESLRDDLATTRVILTSGVAQRVLRAAQETVASFELNSPMVLHKPFTTRDLAEAIRTAVHGVELDRRPLEASNAAPHVSEQELNEALASERIVPYFQPKVRCSDLVVVGVEALARYLTTDGQVLPPSAFVHTADQHGKSTALTIQILSQSLRWLQSTECGDEFHVAVNFSARSLDDGPDVVHQLTDVCRRGGMHPSRVCLELTESTCATDPRAALRFVTQCRVAGFNVSLDDFGIGYSSMAMLAELPITELKIDRRFVSPALLDDEARAILSASTWLARSMGVTSTAEGVEDSDVLELLDDLGCDLAQGFLIARPMSPEQAREWVESRRSEHVRAGSDRSRPRQLPLGVSRQAVDLRPVPG